MTDAEKQVIKMARLVLAAFDLMESRYHGEYFCPHYLELYWAIKALDEQS